MRIWLDPQRMAALGITADDVTNAIQQQNVQAAAGLIGAPPIPNDQVLQYSITALGRLDSVDQFADIIIRTSDAGGIVRVRDIGRVELGAQTYASIGQLNGKPAATMAIYQSPGSNALGVAEAVKAQLEIAEGPLPGRRRLSGHLRFHRLRARDGARDRLYADPHRHHRARRRLHLPAGLARDPHPGADHPGVADRRLRGPACLRLLGQHGDAVRAILAIGLVVDDAIVVVENVQRVMEEKPGIIRPRPRTRRWRR